MIKVLLLFAALSGNAPLWREIAVSDVIVEVNENLETKVLKGQNFDRSFAKKPGVYFFVINASGDNVVKFIDRSEMNYFEYKADVIELLVQEKNAVRSFNNCSVDRKTLRKVAKSVERFSKMQEQTLAKQWILRQDKVTILALISMISDKTKSLNYRSDSYQLTTETKGKLVSALLAWRFHKEGQISFLHMSPGTTGELNGESAWKWFGWRICQGMEEKLF